ncbi:MAG: DNA polymerase III subunit alpha [Alphaproteobacteria bacterium]|nr:DNA polymerase III subunit alpha [Alphaproteobacteria bacterium]MCD8570094.1 DNA polymerase III subunit alpha [Alphaproteobacteria bacterium]
MAPDSVNNQQFVHLHLHSAYSLAEGAIKVKDLVKLCKAGGMPAVAVTDTNNMFGAMEFALEAANNGVQPILGAQVEVLEAGQQMVLLAQTEAGYRNLCTLLSDSYMNGAEQGFLPVTPEALAQYAEGVIALSGGIKGPIAQALLHHQREKAEELAQKLKDIYDERFYIELQRHGWADEELVEEGLLEIAYALNIPLVATNDCYFKNKGAHEAHDALLCISEGRYVTEEDRRKVTKEHYFKSATEMVALFKDIPEAIQNTVQIAKRCSFLLKPINPILPAFTTEEGRSEVEELRAQAEEGLKWRLENFVAKDANHDEYFERLKFELSVIEEMGFPGYFLIVSDFIKWAKDHDIPVGPGRGSGAGSVVAWALKITDLDPLALGLLFERFLNPERVSMPDFDIDFCQERRDEVIRYVQDKYGRDRVAQIITFGKLQARAVVRDVGRVLQMPYGMVDRIAKMIPNNPANPMTLEEALAADPELEAQRHKDETHNKLITIALQLEGLYRHASTHAAGVVIADRPLHELVPVYRDPRSEMPVTQFNMKYVESAGLVKFDFLGLKTMTVVQKAVELVNRRLDKPLDILKIPLDDKNTYNLMAAGNTVGVFQLESAGMRDAMRRIKPTRFEDIIALVSLYRPGPMDNIPLYGRRKNGEEEPDFMHPILEPYLKETHGIMIYQEQVMQAAQALAGYTLGGADLLRRAMGKKIKEEMDAQREMFVKGAAEHHQVPEVKASEIFDQIAKFAGYGFNKSHAAAYALIAYWTAWLKANYPVEFMAASMTLDLGNTDKLSVFKQDLDKMKITLHPPDVNASLPEFAVEGEAVRYALGALKGVGAQAMATIVAERKEKGAYKSLDDFISRIDHKAMNRRQFEAMIAAGAFDSLNSNRAQVSAGVETMLRHAASLAEEKEVGQVNLFGGGEAGSGIAMPALPDIKPWDSLELLAHEFKAVGFYLSAHPLDSRLAQLERTGVRTFAQLERSLESLPAVRTRMAGVLLKKQEKVSQKGSKYAFLQLSDPTGIFEVTIFSETLAANRDVLEPGQTLLLSVDAETREDQVRLTAQGLESLDKSLEAALREVHITLGAEGPIKKLKEFLDAEGEGRIKIKLTVDLGEGRQADVKLPGFWALGTQARNILRTEVGVSSVEEI